MGRDTGFGSITPWAAHCLAGREGEQLGHGWLSGHLENSWINLNIQTPHGCSLPSAGQTRNQCCPLTTPASNKASDLNPNSQTIQGLEKQVKCHQEETTRFGKWGIPQALQQVSSMRGWKGCLRERRFDHFRNKTTTKHRIQQKAVASDKLLNFSEPDFLACKRTMGGTSQGCGEDQEKTQDILERG